MNYEHYNRELDKFIRTKWQYKDELKRRGLITQEEGNDIAARAQRDNKMPFKPTDETMKFLYTVKSHAKKGGKVSLCGREIAYMEKIGVNFKRPDDKGLKGGWE